MDKGRDAHTGDDLSELMGGLSIGPGNDPLIREPKEFEHPHSQVVAASLRKTSERVRRENLTATERAERAMRLLPDNQYLLDVLRSMELDKEVLQRTLEARGILDTSKKKHDHDRRTIQYLPEGCCRLIDEFRPADRHGRESEDPRGYTIPFVERVHLARLLQENNDPKLKKRAKNSADDENCSVKAWVRPSLPADIVRKKLDRLSLRDLDNIEFLWLQNAGLHSSNCWGRVGARPLSLGTDDRSTSSRPKLSKKEWRQLCEEDYSTSKDSEDPDNYDPRLTQPSEVLEIEARMNYHRQRAKAVLKGRAPELETSEAFELWLAFGAEREQRNPLLGHAGEVWKGGFSVSDEDRGPWEWLHLAQRQLERMRMKSREDDPDGAGPDGAGADKNSNPVISRLDVMYPLYKRVMARTERRVGDSDSEEDSSTSNDDHGADGAGRSGAQSHNTIGSRVVVRLFREKEQRDAATDQMWRYGIGACLSS